MAAIVCALHGQTIVSFVSDNVACAVTSGAHPSDMQVLKVELNLGMGINSVHDVDEAMLVGLRQMGLISEDGHCAVSEDAAFEIFAQLKAVCSICLGRWREEQLSSQ